MISSLVSALSKSFDKVLRERQGEYYALTLFKDSSAKYLLCIDATVSEYIYGKVISIVDAPLADCSELLYLPSGLFVFARSVEEFVNKLLGKLGEA